MAEPAWMLDTNALSELIRNPGGPMVQRLAAEAPDAVCTSSPAGLLITAANSSS